MNTRTCPLSSLSARHHSERFEADHLPLCNQWRFHSTDTTSTKLAVSVNQFSWLVLPPGNSGFFFFRLLQTSSSPVSLLAALTQGRPFDPVTQTPTPAGSFNAFFPHFPQFVCGTYIYFFPSFHSLVGSLVIHGSLCISAAAAVNLCVVAEKGVFANPLFISPPCTSAAPTMAHVQRDVLI